MHFSPTNYIKSIRTNNNIEDLILIQVVLKIMLADRLILFSVPLIFILKGLIPTNIHLRGLYNTFCESKNIILVPLKFPTLTISVHHRKEDSSTFSLSFRAQETFRKHRFWPAREHGCEVKGTIEPHKRPQNNRCRHYENTPIPIYRKIFLQKIKIFR